jgi:hypothetical protein
MLLVAISCGSSAWGIGFANGSFEQPGLADATFTTYSVVGTGPTGWSLGNGNASLNNNGARGYGNAFSGSQYVFLPESVTQASLTQTVTGLIPGAVYEFSIRLAGFNNTGTDSSCFVRIGKTSSGGSPFLGLDVSAPAGSTVIGSATSPWKLYSQTFTATISTEEFEIYGYREPPQNAYAAVDDVQLKFGFNGLPAVRIANASKKPITITKAKLSIAGTASSRIPIQSVVVRVKARTVIASGTNVWIARLPLKRGKNRVSVIAVDAAGTASQPATQTVIRIRK